MRCYIQEEKARGRVAEFQPNVVMLGLSPSDYVLRALSSVRTSDLEQTLLVCIWCPFISTLTLDNVL